MLLCRATIVILVKTMQNVSKQKKKKEVRKKNVKEYLQAKKHFFTLQVLVDATKVN